MTEIYRKRDRILGMALNRKHAFELLNESPETLHYDDIAKIPEEERINEEHFERASKAGNECKPVVKVCALTSVTARLVRGQTLHITLRLPVQKDGRIAPMQNLIENYLKVMREQRKNIEFLFIDEISMVPYEMLYIIENRLQHSNPWKSLRSSHVIYYENPYYKNQSKRKFCMLF
ncbi:ATP-dependent DNA helicase [Nephila pilipes]|uniref:ATP-dependent DNA helicase n=1 Tax=Nephila pilipes TaxID=299642 RepID=A0A8X6NWX6_NEPPI|nr:ATP-dependent DNA helicase [Nephila pilipes]